MDTMEPSSAFAGDRDGFERLYTPHRQVYIDSHHESEEPPCPFCAAPTKTDDESLIIHRGVTSFAVLNLYPYNPGHLLICPYRHVADYTDLTDEETREIAILTQQAMRIVRKVSAPDGFNLGMNQGAVAGAGVAGHLHQHVVPRWAGDSNFFPIIAQTKALPMLLGNTREALAKEWG